MQASDFIENRRRLGELLPSNSLAVLFSGKPVIRSGDECFPFAVHRSFFYLTGIREPEVLLIIEKNDQGELKEVLYIPEADPVMEKWVGKTIAEEEAYAFSGIEIIRSFNSWWSDLAQKHPAVFFEDDDLPDHWQKNVHRLMAPMGDRGERKKLSPLMTSLRNIKQPWEIEAIREAIAIAGKGIAAIEDALTPGMEERELEWLFRYITALAGGETTAFAPIIASGANGAILHYSANNRRIHSGDLVLLDLGVTKDCYHSDISRTLCCGTPKEDQLIIYDAVLEVQQRMIPEYRSGVAMKRIQQRTCDFLKEALVDRHFVDENFDIHEAFFHGIGHPLGLDVHDLGRQPDLVLAPGMVMSCEPGLYFADKGIGVRIEDDILITASEPVNLSAAIPKWRSV